MSDWAILEPRHTGHRLWYVRLVLEHLQLLHERSGAAVYTSLEAGASREWQIHLAGISPRVVGQAKISPRTWHRAALAHIGEEPSVVVPDGEPALLPLLRKPRRGETHLLIMRSLPQKQRLGHAKYAAKLLIALLAKWRGRGNVHLHYLAPAPGERVKLMQIIGALAVDDPVTFQPRSIDEASWKEKHGIPVDSRTYLLAGAIGQRKRACQILEAFTHSGPPENVVLVLAGAHDDDVKSALRKTPKHVRSKIVSIDEYLDDDALDTWVAHSQLSLLLYENVGSSGILLKSLAAGRAVAVPRGSDLERRAAHLGLGVVPVAVSSQSVELTFSEHLTVAEAGVPPERELPSVRSFGEQLFAIRPETLR